MALIYADGSNPGTDTTERLTDESNPRLDSIERLADGFNLRLDRQGLTATGRAVYDGTVICGSELRLWIQPRDVFNGTPG